MLDKRARRSELRGPLVPTVVRQAALAADKSDSPLATLNSTLKESVRYLIIQFRVLQLRSILPLEVSAPATRTEFPTSPPLLRLQSTTLSILPMPPPVNTLLLSNIRLPSSSLSHLQLL